MRRDMAEVMKSNGRHIEDCPAYKGLQRKKGNPSPKQERMGPSGRWARHNPSYTPIYRYLASCVGRPWSDIHSEVTKVFRDPAIANRSWRNKSLDWLVEMNCWMEDDDSIWNAGWNQKPIRVDQISRGDPNRNLYVHPETMLLCRPTLVKDEPSDHDLRFPQKIVVDGMELSKCYTHTSPDFIQYTSKDASLKLILKNGCWFEEREIDSHMMRRPVPGWIKKKDPETGKIVMEYNPCQKYVEDTVHVYRTKQLNKRELKRYGLKNGRVNG